MNYKLEKIQAIPTNIITGFLGVGKTTAVLSLLETKPKDERWAVLVNEFGEIGIDGGLFQGQYSEESGVFIREVPGGCMCCAAGLPMLIALNQLLARAKPQRLLIEPTGLGHPKEVLEVLSTEHFRSVLDIQKTVTLVDARKLASPLYTNHDTFNQQIDIADIIVGNKHDLYQGNEASVLEDYIYQRLGEEVKIIFTDHGKLDPENLKGASKAAKRLNLRKHHHQPTESIAEPPMPACGFIRSDNSGEGYCSTGWRFSSEKVFSRTALFAFLTGLSVERLKAIVITDEGVFGYNLADNLLKELELDDCLESRIELIWEAGSPLAIPESFPLDLLVN